MTRIVAGTVGGRTLQVPRAGTRPTSERVREALFSRLEHLDVVDGARVLDLYAGSGALGLEAASRGAAEVTLVEAARAAADVCRANVATLGLGRTVRVVTERVERFLERVPPQQRWDLVLLDPPYDVDERALSAVLDGVRTVLDEGAVVVVERSGRSPEPGWPAGIERTDRRAYGESVLWFAEPVGSHDGTAHGVPGADERPATAAGRDALAGPAETAGEQPPA